MILKSLYDLYQRLLAEGAAIPAPGFVRQQIAYVITITPEGALAGDTPIRSIAEKPVSLIVPGRQKTNSVEPGFLYERLENILGIGGNQAQKYFLAESTNYSNFKDEIADVGYQAVWQFFQSWNQEKADSLLSNCHIDKKKLSGYAVFEIFGDENYVHESATLLSWWKNGGEKRWYRDGETSRLAQCLVTGDIDEIAVTHVPRISGISDKLAPIVSYNHDSFSSYGMKQSLNSAVGKRAAFAYCNALDYLINEKRNLVKIGNVSAVYWSDQTGKSAEESESLFASLFSSFQPEVDDIVKNRLQQIAKGELFKINEDELNAQFYILGLSPSEGRLIVRFFHVSSYGELLTRLESHYASMELGYGKDNEDNRIITPYQILREAVPYKKPDKEKGTKGDTFKDINDKISIAHASGLLHSILTGERYPSTVAMAILHRICVDGNPNHIRCAYLKAWLTRKNSTYTPTPMLDTENTQIGYVLGRLFAIYVITQEKAQGKDLNRTIKESFFCAASSTPRTVFPLLHKLHLHHLAKIESVGTRKKLDRLECKIMDKIGTFPAHTNMEQQGLFMLGYYHQTQDFYTANTTEQ